MLVKVLVENTVSDERFSFEHGLSLYIESGRRKILFDFGASECFLENSQKMNVDLSDVDTAILSHGHYDHGGGLEVFLKANCRARVYMNQGAFGNHYSINSNDQRRKIGLDQKLLPNGQFVFLEKDYSSGDGFSLFANVRGRTWFPAANGNLYIEREKSFVPDEFTHEQNLVIVEEDNNVLFTGCAHNGIVNILEHYYDKNGRFPTHVIGGMHLYGRSQEKSESLKIVKRIGKYLDQTNAMFFTGHCVGVEPFLLLEEILGDKIKRISTGMQLNIGGGVHAGS